VIWGGSGDAAAPVFCAEDEFNRAEPTVELQRRAPVI